MNLYVAEHGNDEKKALSQLNQECGEEEIDEVEEFEIESSVENWMSPMKVKTNARQFAIGNLANQSLYHNVSYKIDNIHLFDVDLEIELKTILDDTFCNVCGEHLQEKVLANETVKEFEVFFDNRYSGRGIHNN